MKRNTGRIGNDGSAVTLGSINSSTVPLASVSFHLAPLNHFNVPIKDKERTETMTGPFAPTTSHETRPTENLWPDLATDTCVRLTGITVRNADGTKERISNADAPKYLVPSLPTHCPGSFLSPTLMSVPGGYGHG